jgi:hypothetical protein
LSSRKLRRSSKASAALGFEAIFIFWREKRSTNFLHNVYRRACGMDREAAAKLMRALVDAGFIVDDQRADAAVE